MATDANGWAGAVCTERKPEPVHKAEEVKLPYRTGKTTG